jgi:hypothetical protein
VTFAIGRGDDKDVALPSGDVSSEALVEALDDTGDAVVSLDGTKFDQAEIAAARAELAKDD